MRHKGKHESQFRVHFYLKNIYYPDGTDPETFIENTAIKL